MSFLCAGAGEVDFGGTSATRRGSQVNPMPENVANPEHLIAELNASACECRAEHDQVLARQSATAEVPQVINSSPSDLTWCSPRSSERRRGCAKRDAGRRDCRYDLRLISP